MRLPMLPGVGAKRLVLIHLSGALDTAQDGAWSASAHTKIDPRATQRILLSAFPDRSCRFPLPIPVQGPILAANLYLLRQFLFISAALAILLHACSGLLLHWGFAANRAYIAKELCVKRDDPGNHCQGACYLKKKLHQVLVTEAAPLEKIPVLPALTLTWEAPAHPDLADARSTAHHRNADLRHAHCALDQLKGGKIFHPPDHLV